jgi:hypothetical protein
VDNPDHLATVRAALDLAGKATPGPWAAQRGGNGFAQGFQDDAPCSFDAGAANAAAIVALRNAAPAIAALCEEVATLRKESRTWSRGEAERQAARAAALESALRAILNAPLGPEWPAAIDAARRLLGEG